MVAGTTATASSGTPTASVVVRPVTPAGRPATGYHVKAERQGSVDCSFAEPSPGAVDANIEECSPSAAYAVACWKTAGAHHALCLRSPRSHTLARVRLSGSFAKTAPAKHRSRAPLMIILADGTTCTIRDGGAWGTLKSHPHWNGSYSCSKHGVVWAAPHASHYGINESSPSWTVHTGPGGGKGSLTVRAVKRAYFVGTTTG